MPLALVQPLYLALGSSVIAQISIDGPIRRCMRRSSLQVRAGRCAYCIDSRFTFLGSVFPTLHAHMPFAFLQPLLRDGISCQIAWLSCIFATSAVHGIDWNGYLTGLWRSFRSLHRLTVFYFELCIPYASCSYATWISATMHCCGVGSAVKMRDFHVSALLRQCKASSELGLLAGLWWSVRSLHRLSVYSFELCIFFLNNKFVTSGH